MPLVIGGTPDGLYDHTPEPTEENLRVFSGIVKAAGAAVGFAQDPDADRLAIVDETGKYIGEELTLALAAKRRFEVDKGKAPLVINLSTSSVSAELAQKAGRQAIRTPVGEIHVVERLLAEKAILGGEGNGGVIDPRVGLVRDSLLGMALVLDLLAASGKPLSKLVSELPVYHMVKCKCALSADSSGSGQQASSSAFSEKIEAIAKAHSDAEVDRRDGLRLAWPDRWVQVRLSNTEPIARVIAEARDEGTAIALAESVVAVVAGRTGEESTR